MSKSQDQASRRFERDRIDSNRDMPVIRSGNLRLQNAIGTYRRFRDLAFVAASPCREFAHQITKTVDKSGALSDLRFVAEE